MKLKFNWRVISIHLLATIFILLAAKRFSLFYDFSLVESYTNYGNFEHIKLLPDTTIGERIISFIHASIIASLLGLLTSFLISLTICLKRKIHWVNSLIVLIIGILLNKLELLYMPDVKKYMNCIGNLFVKYGFKYTLIINSGLFVLIGLFIFLNKWTNNFITKPND